MRSKNKSPSTKCNGLAMVCERYSYRRNC